MKKIRFYAAIGLLTANLVLTSCSSEKIEEVDPATIERIINTTEMMIAEQNRILEEKLERDREEKAAFEKAITNPEFIETEDFKSINKVTINYDNIRNYYEVECTNDSKSYTIAIPEERLISYMIRNCNVEYLSLNNLNDSTILEELNGLKNLKEILIYNSNIDNFDALRKYTSISGLRIANCPNLSDISFFENLPNLVAVEIVGTKVSDITPLSFCENLKSAKLRCNLITNIEALNNLEYLTSIQLEYNQITDVKQLEGLVKKGIVSQEIAELFVETTTNHKLIISSNDETMVGTILSLYYYPAIEAYYAEVKDSEGYVVAFACTDEPYVFYNLSEKVQEKRSLYVSNFPETGYIHHLNGASEYERVVIDSCDFDYLPITDFSNLVSLAIYNCPNLVNTFEDYPFKSNDELKYLCVRNTGINTFDRLTCFRNLEVVDLQNNNADNFDVLKEMKSLTSATITLDNPEYDYKTLQDLVNRGVELKIYAGVEKENSKDKKVPKKALDSQMRAK